MPQYITNTLPHHTPLKKDGDDVFRILQNETSKGHETAPIQVEYEREMIFWL